jgi:NAD(P)-dependent dehydrogenase (short-subunit alcohol dehydrogenase family)
MREEVKLMKPRGKGVIINFASIAAHVGFAGLTVYTASKAAVLAMTKSAALELAQTGVRVASVSPGLVATAMLERFFAADENARATMTGSLPLGRACEPEEIARGVLFLASDDASLVVGQTLNLDGGWAYVGGGVGGCTPFSQERAGSTVEAQACSRTRSSTWRAYSCRQISNTGSHCYTLTARHPPG